MKPFKTCIAEYFNEVDRTPGRKSDGRAASFDYCYEYFYSHYRNGTIKELTTPQNISTSCLQLGFYLASWGMLRGSCYLLQRSVRHYRELIQTIANSDPILWEIDLNDYDNEHTRKRLIQCSKSIANAVGNGKCNPTETLLTKIMLGVFGNIPAFDTYFISGIRKTGRRFSGALNDNSLTCISDCYNELAESIEETDIRCLSLETGEETDIKYPKAKILDMYFVMVGGYEE